MHFGRSQRLATATVLCAMMFAAIAPASEALSAQHHHSRYDHRRDTPRHPASAPPTAKQNSAQKQQDRQNSEQNRSAAQTMQAPVTPRHDDHP